MIDKETITLVGRIFREARPRQVDESCFLPCDPQEVFHALEPDILGQFVMWCGIVDTFEDAFKQVEGFDPEEFRRQVWQRNVEMLEENRIYLTELYPKRLDGAVVYPHQIPLREQAILRIAQILASATNDLWVRRLAVWLSENKDSEDLPFLDLTETEVVEAERETS